MLQNAHNNNKIYFTCDNGKLEVVDISSQITFTSNISNASCFVCKYGKIIFIRLSGTLSESNSTLHIATINGYDDFRLLETIASGIGYGVDINFGGYLLSDGKIFAKSSIKSFDLNIITIEHSK